MSVRALMPVWRFYERENKIAYIYTSYVSDSLAVAYGSDGKQNSLES